MMTEIAATAASSIADGPGIVERSLGGVELAGQVFVDGESEDPSNGLPIDVDPRRAGLPRRYEPRDRSASDRDREGLAGLGLPQHGGDVVPELALWDSPISHLLHTVADERAHRIEAHGSWPETSSSP